MLFLAQATREPVLQLAERRIEKIASLMNIVIPRNIVFSRWHRNVRKPEIGATVTVTMSNCRDFTAKVLSTCCTNEKSPRLISEQPTTLLHLNKLPID